MTWEGKIKRGCVCDKERKREMKELCACTIYNHIFQHSCLLPQISTPFKCSTPLHQCVMHACQVEKRADKSLHLLPACCAIKICILSSGMSMSLKANIFKLVCKDV